MPILLDTQACLWFTLRERELSVRAREAADLLPITAEHAARTLDLPFHHRDPFDRMLAAQSLVEGWPVISSDEILDAYGVKRIW